MTTIEAPPAAPPRPPTGDGGDGGGRGDDDGTGDDGGDGAEAATRRRSRLLLAGMLLVMGTLHVVVPRGFERIIPSWLAGRARFWVYASGVAELGSGALLLSRRTERVGGAAAAATIAAVYPANIQMALDAGVPRSPGAWATWLRLPLQFPMIAWALRHARR